MANSCNLPYKAIGPYNQTLFLGCSITNFNISLGWGAEASTLTVNLLEDKAYHPSSVEYEFMDRNLERYNDPSSDYLTSRSTALRIDPNTGSVGGDNTKATHKNLAIELENQERSRFANNKRLYDNPRTTDNINIIDNGKVVWNTNGAKKFWRDPDPGFLGMPNRFNDRGYDLVGCPVVFKFDDIVFAGMLHSWRNAGSQGGWPTYEVEVRSFASLLNGCQLIIDSYAGTVASIIPNTSDNSTGEDVCVPHPYGLSSAGNFSHPYNGSIRQGNLPNVFNIYGYLEWYGNELFRDMGLSPTAPPPWAMNRNGSGSFGYSNKTDRGIPAIKIYDALVAMLGPGTDASHSSFNPYGAILGKAFADMDGNPTDPTSVYLNQRIDALAGETPIDHRITLEYMGISRNRIAVDGHRHSMFKLDLSEVPAPPYGLYLQGPTMSIMQFITEICDGAGLDFFVDFIPSTDNYSGTIKIRTVSRRIQPNKEVIKSIVNGLVSQNVSVSSYNYGQEFNDQNTRVMYIGGKQKRLLQVKATPLANKQNTMVFDPFANAGNGSFIDYSSLGQPGTNQAREPNFFSTRRYKYRMAPGGGAVVAESQFKNTFGGGFDEGSFGDNVYFSSASSSNVIQRGNYHDAVNIQTIIELISIPNQNHPYYTNMISPYFGVGADGLGRKVYFDPSMGQMQIVFDVADITKLMSIPQLGYDGFSSNSSKFLVLENEIRAAGGGFGPWLDYCFNNFFTTDIQEIMFKIFRKYYGSINSRNLFLYGIKKVFEKENVKFTNIVNGTPHRHNLNDCDPFVKELYNNLHSIHSFFQGIATEYYGKQYMVKIISPRWYEDNSIINTTTFDVTAQIDNGVSNTIYIRKGSGKIYTDWELSPDGAWEEPGNWIDDTIVVGSSIASMMSDATGKIPPMLGFNSSAEYDFRINYFGRKGATARSVAYGMYSSGGEFMSPDYRHIVAYELFHNENDSFYKSIHHNLPIDEYIELAYTSPAALNMKTSHGIPLGMAGGKISKMYAKSSLAQNIIFLDSIDGIRAEPRAILSLSSAVFTGSLRNRSDYDLNAVKHHDGILKYMRGSSVPSTLTDFFAPPPPPLVDISSYNGANILAFRNAITIWGGLRANPTSYNLRNIIGSLWINETQAPMGRDESYSNTRILPRAAPPAFAAVPIQSNLAIYGPWINHPGSIEENIFAGRPNPSGDVNNLVGGVKVVVDDGLVPWNYGGMDSLDEAVLEKIFEDVNYQQVNEQGMIQVPGYVLAGTTNGIPFNVGDSLSYLGAIGPIINNIQVQIGEGGITTTYNMRTYVRKLGFFNKENADRIKLIGQESLKRRKEIYTEIAKVQSQLTTSNTSAFGNGTAAEIYDMIRNHHTIIPKMMSASPSRVLAGYALDYINDKSQIVDMKKQLNYSPSWNTLPYTKDKNIEYNSEQMLNHVGDTMLYDVDEVPKELYVNYHKKSLMSLDGILSPVSFYPTDYSSTYHMSKYPREKCPFCKGTGRYSYRYTPDQASLNTASNDCPGTFRILDNSLQAVTETCKFCEPQSEKDKRNYTSISPKETSPPYIIASGNDLEIISRNSLQGMLGISGNPVINQSTLNPILMSRGEFSCFQNRQTDDFTGHSIDIVADGATPPEYDNFIQLLKSNQCNKRFSDYDEKLIDFAQNHPNLKINTSFKIANNVRFFGLRGPLMVHGWGYDLDGYPIPNSSGEPKLDSNGDIITDDDGNVIYKNQTRNPDGSWTKPYKEHTFYKGWGQLPGTWPVGPVDLRWDDNAKVWTIGANYKNVWIQIENDLIGSEPSRGQIISDLDKNPLPSGLRKLVFVKDNLGINPAPRGAQIYCKYDSDSGFYEPIYNRPLITSGVIQGAASVDIYQMYSTDNTTYRTTYKNPLGFEAANGTNGLFIFIGDSWVLQSYN